MIDLAKVTRAAMAIGMDVSHHHKNVAFSYIPEIQEDEALEVFNIQRMNGMGFDNGIQCIIVKRNNGEVYIIGCLESSRFQDAWRFLNSDEYAFYVNEILPTYNHANVSPYVRTPLMSAIHDHSTGTDLQEFYYYTKISFPKIESDEMEDNILVNALGEMVLNISLYRTLVNGHYDIGLKKWHVDHNEIRDLNGSHCDVMEVDRGILTAMHKAYEKAFIVFNGRIYTPIVDMRQLADLLHIFTEDDHTSNKQTLAPYIEHLEKCGIDLNLSIFTESEFGPGLIIGQKLMRLVYGKLPEKFNMLVIELTPASARLNLGQVMSHYLACATTKEFQSSPISATRTHDVAKKSIKRPLAKIEKESVPSNKNTATDLSGFYEPSIKSS